MAKPSRLARMPLIQRTVSAPERARTGPKGRHRSNARQQIYFVPSDSDFSGWSSVVLGFTLVPAEGGEDPVTLATGTIFSLPEPSAGLLLSMALIGLAAREMRQRPRSG